MEPFCPPTALAATNALRSSFLSFFQRHDHLILPSAGLVPSSGDESLLFTNAGMVPLKEMLLGVAPPPQGSNGRLASAQKCVRAGGKHNDLENVGHVSEGAIEAAARITPALGHLLTFALALVGLISDGAASHVL